MSFIIKIDRIFDDNVDRKNTCLDRRVIDSITYTSKSANCLIIENSFKRVYSNVVVAVDKREIKGVVLAFAHLMINNVQVKEGKEYSDVRFNGGDIYSRYGDWITLTCSIRVHSLYENGKHIPSFHKLTLDNRPLETRYYCDINVGYVPDSGTERNLEDKLEVKYRNIPPEDNSYEDSSSEEDEPKLSSTKEDEPKLSSTNVLPPTPLDLFKTTLLTDQLTNIIESLAKSINNLTNPK